MIKKICVRLFVLLLATGYFIPQTSSPIIALAAENKLLETFDAIPTGDIGLNNHEVYRGVGTGLVESTGADGKVSVEEFPSAADKSVRIYATVNKWPYFGTKDNQILITGETILFDADLYINQNSTSAMQITLLGLSPDADLIVFRSTGSNSVGNITVKNNTNPLINQNGSNLIYRIKEWFRLRVVIHTDTKTMDLYVMDSAGTQVVKNVAIPNPVQPFTGINNFRFQNLNYTKNPSDFYVNNLHIRPLEELKLLSASPEDGSTMVNVNTQVQLNFSNPISEVSKEQFTVTGIDVLSQPSVSLVEVDSQTCILTFLESFEYDKEYQVSFREIQDIFGQEVSGSLSFQTQKIAISEPEFFKLNLTDGIKEKIASLTPGLIYAKVEITNRGSSSNGILVAVLKKDGILQNITFQEGVLPTGETVTLNAGVLVPDKDGAYSIEVFVWDTFMQMTVLSNPYQFDLSGGQYKY